MSLIRTISINVQVGYGMVVAADFYPQTFGFLYMYTNNFIAGVHQHSCFHKLIVNLKR
jgi:hypothetical protein